MLRRPAGGGRPMPEDNVWLAEYAALTRLLASSAHPGRAVQGGGCGAGASAPVPLTLDLAPQTGQACAGA